MTVLDQVLEAEKANESAVSSAREAAAKTVAEAKVAQQVAIADAQAAATKTVEAATVAAKSKADTEATHIMSAATKDAAAVKGAIEGKSAELTKRVVAAFNTTV